MAAHWDDRIAPMLAITVEHQREPERSRIVEAIRRGDLEYFLDVDRGVVVWQAAGLAFCEMSYAAIVGCRIDPATAH
jgi:hypothetical protein